MHILSLIELNILDSKNLHAFGRLANELKITNLHSKIFNKIYKMDMNLKETEIWFKYLSRVRCIKDSEESIFEWIDYCNINFEFEYLLGMIEKKQKEIEKITNRKKAKMLKHLDEKDKETDSNAEDLMDFYDHKLACKWIITKALSFPNFEYNVFNLESILNLIDDIKKRNILDFDFLKIINEKICIIVAHLIKQMNKKSEETIDSIKKILDQNKLEKSNKFFKENDKKAYSYNSKLLKPLLAKLKKYFIPIRMLKYLNSHQLQNAEIIDLLLKRLNLYCLEPRDQIDMINYLIKIPGIELPKSIFSLLQMELKTDLKLKNCFSVYKYLSENYLDVEILESFDIHTISITEKYKIYNSDLHSCLFAIYRKKPLLNENNISAQLFSFKERCKINLLSKMIELLIQKENDINYEYFVPNAIRKQRKEIIEELFKRLINFYLTELFPSMMYKVKEGEKISNEYLEKKTKLLQINKIEKKEIFVQNKKILIFLKMVLELKSFGVSENVDTTDSRRMVQERITKTFFIKYFSKRQLDNLKSLLDNAKHFEILESFHYLIAPSLSEINEE